VGTGERIIRELRRLGVEGLDELPVIEAAQAFARGELARANLGNPQTRQWALRLDDEVPSADDLEFRYQIIDAKYAISSGLGALREEARSARLAAGAADQGSHAMTGLYRQSSERERGWQAAAIEKLRANHGRPITPAFFADIPEYDRGPVIEE
jgi:hypothetical protein